MTTDLVRQHFVALTPSDLPQAQHGIAEWCTRKIQALGRELREQRQNLAQAKAAKWKHSGWVSAANRTKQRMIYYAKIKAAVQAGYLIVPNFEVEVMAVRVGRETPPAKFEDTTRSWVGDFTVAKEELLPHGVGRYVDEQLSHTLETYEKKRDNGTTETHYRREIDGYGQVDFPVLAIKPQILDATAHAMGQRLFDRIGIVTGRKQDPVVVGEIIDPGTNRSWARNHQKRVTFFIAWWLDTASL